MFYWVAGRDRPIKVTLAGRGQKWNTNGALGGYGIYEGYQVLRRKGLQINDGITEVYIANHFRAILDLLYHNIKESGRADALHYATSDWLDTEQQKNELLEKAELLRPLFNEDEKRTLLKWIQTERSLPS